MFESMDFASLLPRRQTTEEQQAQVDEQQDDMCSLLPTLTWSERLIGCGTCMVAGYILSFGSFFRIKELILGNPGRQCIISSNKAFWEVGFNGLFSCVSYVRPQYHSF